MPAQSAIDSVRRGDTPVASKPDRLARSTINLLRTVDDLDRRGVGLITLSIGGQTIDTRSQTGELIPVTPIVANAYRLSVYISHQFPFPPIA
jgi:DNA invertase Pin-like site-specific DNA recombinase